jgi:hypothetical protein
VFDGDHSTAMQVAAFITPALLQGLVLLSLWVILRQAAKQQGRILLGLDDLEFRLKQGGFDGDDGEAPDADGLQPETAVEGSESVPDVAGGTLALDDYRGKRLLLVNWSPGCK